MMIVSKAMIADLEKFVPNGVSENVLLAEISRWKIGGSADVIIRPKSPEQVQALRRYFYQNSINHIVIGMTSNLLFSDAGLRVPCIQIDNRMGNVDISNGIVNAQAGAWVPGLSRKIQQAGLSGAEHICGIPGTIGGLICMNGGSQRKGIGGSVVEVTSIDEVGERNTRTANECQFAYRESVFQRNNEIVVKTVLRFEKTLDSKAAVRREMLKILSSRRRKFPRKLPNCGSVFKSDPAMYEDFGPPGEIIEKLGLKGVRVGDAQVSPDHANFIVNKNRATSNDVLDLMGLIKRKVESETGCTMNVEVLYLEQDGKLRPAC